MDNIQVTHNNDNHHYRIAMDIAKEGSSLWDLTPYVKGRVGDNRFGLQVTWTYQGQLMNVEGMKPYIEGNVGQYSFDDQNNLQLDPNSGVVRYVGDPADCQAGGQVTYYFPEQMFPKEGIFKGYIGLLDDRDDSQNPHISGVTVWFKVLPGIAQMGHACDVYISDLDKALQNFKVKLDQHDKDYQTQLQQVIDDARNAYESETKNAHDAVVAASQEIAAVRSDTKDLADQVGSQQNYISAHNIVTTDKFTDLSNDLTRYVTESFVQPEAFNSLDELKLTYPSGKKGICVVIDTGHFYVWQDNTWKDCGSFQSAGIADKSIHIEKFSSTLQNGFYPEVTEIKIDHINTGYIDWHNGAVNTNVSENPNNGYPVHTDMIAVKPDEEYYVCTQNYWDGKAVIFFNQDKVVKYLPLENDAQRKNIKITIPHDVNGIVLNGTRTFLPRLFKVNYYFEVPQPVKSIANLIKNQDYNFAKVELTKKAEVGYWDITFDGNFHIFPVDKTRAQISYEPIKVEPFEVYKISGCSGWDARLYEIIDAKGHLVDYCSTKMSTNMSETIMIPENGAYLELNELFLNTQTTLEKAISVKEKLPLSGKTWTALGDSWTQIFADQNKSYVNDVAELTGLTAKNSGAGGTGFITGGANNGNNQFYKHPIDANSDIVTIFGSFNDAYDGDFKFGQEGDTGTDTLWGALQHVLDHIYESAFGTQVGIISPGPWGAINQHLSSDLKMSTLASFKDETVNSMSIRDFAEQYVKVLHDFAKLNSLPFLDLYHYSGLRPWDDKFINQYYHGESETDTTHPNADTMKQFIAPKIAKFIEGFAPQGTDKDAPLAEPTQSTTPQAQLNQSNN